MPPRKNRLLLKLTMWSLGATTITFLPAQPAAGGGGPENTLVIIDPGDPDSTYLGNYYISARLIPPRNVMYVGQEAADYSTFVNHQLEAVLGEVSNRGIEDHIDYVVLASGLVYRLSATGYITDGECIGLSRFSLSSAYTVAHLANAILAGNTDERYGLTTTEPNEYASETDSARSGPRDPFFAEAIDSMAASVRRSRSTIASDRPNSPLRARSFSLAA